MTPPPAVGAALGKRAVGQLSNWLAGAQRSAARPGWLGGTSCGSRPGAFGGQLSKRCERFLLTFARIRLRALGDERRHRLALGIAALAQSGHGAEPIGKRAVLADFP